MSFGFINVGDSYQSMVNNIFGDMIGNTMEAYVNDMLVKFKLSINHQGDLEKEFARMKLYNVRLNPSKYAFSVNSRCFLVFMVKQIGIESNPEKNIAIENMKSSTCQKKVQRLNRCMADLKRFLSNSWEKSLFFFQVLKGNKKFEWMPECQDVFQLLKDHLKTLPPLAKPMASDTLFMYLSISLVPVSFVIIK